MTRANIITPTTQNLANMQEDIKAFIQPMIDKNLSKEEIIKNIEKLIRAYDPCISCATHFLKINGL